MPEQEPSSKPPSEQLVNDARIVELLRQNGFPERGMGMVKDRLWEKGQEIVPGLIYSGEIYRRARDRNPRIKALYPPTPPWKWDQCVDISLEVIMKSWQRFERDALRAGRWDPAQGATLATHFVNTCVDTFPNIFRSWRRAQARRVPAELVTSVDLDALLIAHPGLGRDHGVSPPFITDHELACRIPRLTPGERQVLRLRLDGLDNHEIAEHLNKNPGAVATTFSRAKQKVLSQRVASEKVNQEGGH